MYNKIRQINIAVQVKRGVWIMMLSNETKGVRDVVATMAIEDMYLSREFVTELIKVSQGKRTSESLRQEVIKKYAR